MRDFLHIFIITNFFLNFICASELRVRRENMKVRISTKGDTILLKFMRSHIDTKLEGFILGYGGNMFSKQFIQLPENGEPYETEIDAEPKYLIAVKQVKANEVKKQCTEKVTLEKPLHLVIGSVTPTSVLLSWATLLKTPYTDTVLDDCIEEGQFTVRYRENETSKQWNYQTCPTTNTIIDNLKPNTPYEFGVRADTDNISGDWTPPVIHNTADVDIHKLFKPKNQLRPEEPIIKAPEVFLPPVPGTGGDDVNSPPEDPLSLIQTLTFSHTPTSQSPSKTTNTFQTQQRTKERTTYNTPLNQPITIKFHSTIQLQSTSNQPQNNTAQSQTSNTQIKASTVQPHVRTSQSKPEAKAPEKSRATQHITSKGQLIHSTTPQTQPYTTKSQPITTPPQLRTTQPSTVRLNVKTSKSKHERASQKPSPTQLSTISQSQLNTTKSYLIINQPQSQPMSIQPENSITQPQESSIKQQPSTAQTQYMTVQSNLITTPRTPQTTKKSQSKKMETKSSTAQSNTQFIPITKQPTLIQEQPWTIKKQSNKIQQPSTSQENIYKTKQQPALMNPKPTRESNTYYQFSTTQYQQMLSTNPFSITSNKDGSFLSMPLTLPKPKAVTQRSVILQHTTTHYLPYDNNNSYSTIEIETRTWEQPQTSTTFHQQQVPGQYHQSTSPTIQYYNTTQWKYNNYESSPESKSQDTYSPQSTTEHAPDVSIQPSDLMAPRKSNANQNSPQAEKAVNKKLRDSKAAPSQSQDGQPSPKPAHVREVTSKNKVHSGEKHKGLLLPKPSKRPRKNLGNLEVTNKQWGTVMALYALSEGLKYSLLLISKYLINRNTLSLHIFC